MKFKTNINYNSVDFTPEEIKQLESEIALNLKPEEKEIGAMIIYRGIIFAIEAIIYDFDSGHKFINISQKSTHQKIQPIGVLKN